MKFDLLPDVLTGAVVLAGLYLLVGLAWVIVFRASRLWNFSTGQMFVLAGYLVATFTAKGLDYWLSGAITILILIVLGVATYYFLLRPFAGQPLFTPVIVTFGLATVIDGIIPIAFGINTKSIKPPFADTNYHWPGGISVSTYDLILPAVALVFYLGLLAFLRWTRFGSQMRASHENTLLASQSGVGIYVIFAVAFAISFLAIALAGITDAQRTLVSTTAIPIGLKGLVPAMVGGLDSVGGALVGALIVAVAESLSILYLGGQYSNFAVFTILLIVLAVRPYGIFGSKEIERV